MKSPCIIEVPVTTVTRDISPVLVKHRIENRGGAIAGYIHVRKSKTFCSGVVIGMEDQYLTAHGLREAAELFNELAFVIDGKRP